MLSKRNIFSLFILVLTIALSGCGNVDELSNNTTLGDAQPQTTRSRDTKNSTQTILSVQIRTFESIISSLKQYYVHGKEQSVPYDDIETRYRTKILSMLDYKKFPDIIHDLISELPADAATWESREERIERQATDTTNYEGIGAYVAFRPTPTPRVIILSVMPGSPAEKAGIKDHDSLLSVDDIPITIEEGSSAISRIRGPSGSIARLVVKSPNQPPRLVGVTRNKVQLSENANRLRYTVFSDGTIVYLLFPRQSTSSLSLEVIQTLTQLGQEQPINGIILDLRIASIGDSWPLQEMLTIFSNGLMGSMYSSNEIVTLNIKGQDISGSQKIPLVILIGRDTEGRAEIFAAALQSTGRAIVVGTRTDGNIESVHLIPLLDGSRIFVSSTSYKTVSGFSVGLFGIEPNIRVNTDWDSVTNMKDPIINSALLTLRREKENEKY